MKKHLFGLAIFSFIFASFVIAFAYLYAPMEICPIRQPVIKVNTRNNCQKNPQDVTDISFEVLTTQFDLDKKKLISKIKMTIGNNGKMPTSVLVGSNLYLGKDTKPNSLKKLEYLDDNSGKNLFEPSNESSNEVVFNVEFDFTKNKDINRKENLYAIFSFEIGYMNSGKIETFGKIRGTESVLIIHGKNSIIKK